MRHNSFPHIWNTGLGLLALLSLRVAPAQAEIPATSAYNFSSHPMISGTVASVSDHQLVVDTDQGEQVTLEIDPHTVAPANLTAGMIVRSDFTALNDGRFRARRVMAVRNGMPLNRQQAYAQTNDTGVGALPGAPAMGTDTREAQFVPSPAANALAAPHPMVDYLYSTRPMISGRVVSVTDHQVVVETDQGQQVSMVMDSRTMVPAQVAPGTYLRAEFKPMKDGRNYATRIQSGSSTVAEREQVYSHTQDNNVALAAIGSDCNCMAYIQRNAPMQAALNEPDKNTGTAAVTPGASEPVADHQAAAVENPEPVAVNPEPVVENREPMVEKPATLPQTAGNQSLLLLLALLALAGGGAMIVARNRWNG